MVTPRTRDHAVVAWGTNITYPTRVHMTNGRGRVSLCGFPVSTVTHDRPGALRVCPECAMSYVEVSFPADGGAGPDGGYVEWFRQLPPAPEFHG